MTVIPEIDKDLVRWSRKKWVACFLFIFLAQLGGILWASRGGDASPSEPRPVPMVVLGNTPRATAVAAAVAVDPLLFASADAKGFSGAAWLYPHPWDYEYDGFLRNPEYVHFSDAAPLLRRPPPSLPVHQVADGPLYAARATPAEPLRPSDPGQSRLRFAGDLAARRLMAAPELPVQRTTDVLNNSIVEVGVNPDGLVVSTRLIQRSGSKTADQDALRLARQARFAPAPAADLELAWGKLIFQWFALNSPGTNAAPR